MPDYAKKSAKNEIRIELWFNPAEFQVISTRIFSDVVPLFLPLFVKPAQQSQVNFIYFIVPNILRVYFKTYIFKAIQVT